MTDPAGELPASAQLVAAIHRRRLARRRERDSTATHLAPVEDQLECFLGRPAAGDELITRSDHPRPPGRRVEVGHALECFHLEHGISLESAKLMRRLQPEL